jgi:hypothetical protein
MMIQNDDVPARKSHVTHQGAGTSSFLHHLEKDPGPPLKNL